MTFCKDLMKRTLILLAISLAFFLLCPGSPRAAQEIVAVQSIGIQPYQDALNGFTSAGNYRVHQLIISEMDGAALVGRIRQIKPRMVLAIGIDALTRVSTITDIPVIYLMVLNPPAALAGKRNVYGVRMSIPQEQQLQALVTLLPAAKTVGLLYNPDRTGELVERMTEAAKKNGTRLVAKTVRSSRSVPQRIQELKGQIDAFLMLPDLTVVTPETVEALLLFSLENKIPLVSFSEKYVEMGALMSIGVDAFDMGMQAAEMAEKILSGKDLTDARQVDARKAVISINRKVAKKLGISIDEPTVSKGRAID